MSLEDETGESRTNGQMRSQLTSTQSLFRSIARFAAMICIGATSVAGASPTGSTPQDVFDAMRGSFQPAKAKGVHARYQWWVEVNDGSCKIGKGTIPEPTVTFTATDKDWVAICHDQLSGTWAYITGRLKVRGDQGVARKLGEMFP